MTDLIKREDVLKITKEWRKEFNNDVGVLGLIIAFEKEINQLPSQNQDINHYENCNKYPCEQCKSYENKVIASIKSSQNDKEINLLVDDTQEEVKA